MQRYLNHVRPHVLAKRLNRDLARIVGRSGRFATGLIVTYFSQQGHLSICNAGHPPPLLFRAKSREWEIAREASPKAGINNLPLGVIEDSGYVGHKLTLESGDLLLGYTDCLIEATAEDGQMLMVDGLRDLVAAIDPARLTDPKTAVDALLGAINDAGYRLDDDLTMFLLECTERSRGRGLGPLLTGTWRAIKQARRPWMAPLPDLLLRWKV
jgi:serine phosphatase RsbU (regulator of sigma subunit)